MNPLKRHLLIHVMGVPPTHVDTLDRPGVTNEEIASDPEVIAALERLPKAHMAPARRTLGLPDDASEIPEIDVEEPREQLIIEVRPCGARESTSEGDGKTTPSLPDRWRTTVPDVLPAPRVAPMAHTVDVVPRPHDTGEMGAQALTTPAPSTSITEAVVAAVDAGVTTEPRVVERDSPVAPPELSLGAEASLDTHLRRLEVPPTQDARAAAAQFVRRRAPVVVLTREEVRRQSPHQDTEGDRATSVVPSIARELALAILLMLGVALLTLWYLHGS